MLLAYLPWDQGTRNSGQSDVVSMVDYIISSDSDGKRDIALQTCGKIGYLKCWTFYDFDSLLLRADRKSQVRQCLSFCTADFWSLLAYKSAEQPKH